MSELSQFLNLLPVPVARFGESGALELLNPAAEGLLRDVGIDPAAVDLDSLLHRLNPAQSTAAQSPAGASAAGAARACVVTPPHGPARHWRLRMVRPDSRSTLITLEDVTGLVEQERELRRQRRRAQLVLEHIRGYCVALLDASGTVTEWNPSLGKLLGMAAADGVRWPLLTRVAVNLPGVNPTACFADVQHVIARRGLCRVDATWTRGDGQEMSGECVIAPVSAPDGSDGGYVAVIRDVSIERFHAQELIDAALTDPLTGLLNRRGLEGRSEAMHFRPGGSQLSQVWIMVDLDHFKHVNDSFGHEAGDEVLCAVADALRATARVGDIVARFGGEEFVVVLPDTSADVAARIAERLRLAVETLAINVGGRVIRVTASFGVAQRQTHESQIAVLDRADAALYTSKTAGRNLVTVC